MKLIFVLILGLGLSSLSQADSVDSDGARCDRTITFDSLSPADQARLRKDEQVVHFVMQNNGYEMGYVLKISGYDPELVMAVYSRADKHAGKNGLGDFIVRSEIVGAKPGQVSNPYKVFYEQQVDFFSNGEYTMENTIKQGSGGGYLQSSKLLDSSDEKFSPRWADGYLKAVPYGTGVFVVACNYMVPRSTSWAGKFKETSRERLIASGINLLNWVNRVAHDKQASEAYRARLRAMLNH